MGINKKKGYMGGSRNNFAHAFSRRPCKEVHRLDGLAMSTVGSDEGDIAEMVLQQYILALFHKPNTVQKLVRFGHKRFGPFKRFGVALQVGVRDVVNTRDIPWAVVSEDDPDWKHLDWRPYNNDTHLMVHIRVYYGRKEDLQVAKINIFPRIDGRDNDLTTKT